MTSAIFCAAWFIYDRQIEWRISVDSAYWPCIEGGTATALNENTEPVCMQFRLADRRTFSYTALGFAGLPPIDLYAFGHILTQTPDPDAIFKSLLEDQSLVSQLYGLMGTYWTDPAQYAEALPRFRTMRGTILIDQGCDLGREERLQVVVDDIANGLAQRYALHFDPGTSQDDIDEAEQAFRLEHGLPEVFVFRPVRATN